MNTANDLFFEWNDCIFWPYEVVEGFSVIFAFDVCGPLVRMANIFLFGVRISKVKWDPPSNIITCNYFGDY